MMLRWSVRVPAKHFLVPRASLIPAKECRVIACRCGLKLLHAIPVVHVTLTRLPAALKPLQICSSRNVLPVPPFPVRKRECPFKLISSALFWESDKLTLTIYKTYGILWIDRSALEVWVLFAFIEQKQTNFAVMSESLCCMIDDSKRSEAVNH